MFCDDGITGTSMRNRRGLLDLLTKSISRFARNTVDLLETVRELSSLGVAVRFERENIDTHTAQGELLLTLLASFAQAESESNSAAVAWVIRKKFESGDIHSRSTYGYRYTNGTLTVIESEAWVVRRVFENYLAGITPEATVDELNTAGVKPRRGKKFHPGTLRRWLENETYAGMPCARSTTGRTSPSTPRGATTATSPPISCRIIMRRSLTRTCLMLSRQNLPSVAASVGLQPPPAARTR
ncbi:recombinase family protein [Corynebacterium guaraldiae]|uniref:recombinase family protein n=1 Tax=Corynebacterium guaraldiae TaxID=3051103 RepID=UPI002094A409|nr:recombinase family protein [Corynebacterium guaraldiae]